MVADVVGGDESSAGHARRAYTIGAEAERRARWRRPAGTGCRPGTGPSCPCPSGRAWRPSWSTTMREPRGRDATGGRPMPGRAPPAPTSAASDAGSSRGPRRPPATAAGDADCSTQRAPRSPHRRRPSAVVDQRPQPVDERRRVVRRDRHAAPDAVERSGGTSVPGSIAATTGGRRRGSSTSSTARSTAASPRAQWHDVDVAGGQHLGEPVVGLRSRRSGRWRARRRLASRSGRAEPSPLITNVDVGQAPGGGEHQLERLREPDVAGVHARPARRRCRARAVRRHPVAGRMRVGVDEVRDHVHLRRSARPASLAATLSAGRPTAR